MGFWIFATVCAFFVKGLCGFANTLVFSTLLSFGTANINISPVELLLGYPTNLILAYKERKSIQWKICIPLTALVLAGCIPGILFLKNADTHVIKLFFGFVIIFTGLEMLLREFRQKKLRESKLLMALIGILSGLLCGLYGIGALLGAYISRVTEDSHGFKANICFVFSVENTLRIVLYAVWGIFNPGIIKAAFALMPFMALGLFLGMKSSRRLDERIVKRLVILLLIFSGIALLYANF